MKKVVFIYWSWYICLLALKINGLVSLPQFVANIFGFLIVSSFTYLIICTIMFDRTLKRAATFIDVKYMNIAVASLITRSVILSIATFGVNKLEYIMLCNVLTIPFYFLVKRKIDKLDYRNIFGF